MYISKKKRGDLIPVSPHPAIKIDGEQEVWWDKIGLSS